MELSYSQSSQLPAPLTTTSPFVVCECSGPTFFGEGRIECFEEPVPRFVGDTVLFCISNELLDVTTVHELQLGVGLNETYFPVRNGIPDLHTDVQAQDGMARVLTVLDESWFPNNTTIATVFATVEGTGIFNASTATVGGDDDDDSSPVLTHGEKRNLRAATTAIHRNHERNLQQDSRDGMSTTGIVALVLFLTSICCCCMIWPLNMLVRWRINRIAQNEKNRVRQQEIRDFQTYAAAQARGENVTWRGTHFDVAMVRVVGNGAFLQRQPSVTSVTPTETTVATEDTDITQAATDAATADDLSTCAMSESSVTEPQVV